LVPQVCGETAGLGAGLKETKLARMPGIKRIRERKGRERMAMFRRRGEAIDY
jgi:hypothetical protein